MLRGAGRIRPAKNVHIFTVFIQNVHMDQTEWTQFRRMIRAEIQMYLPQQICTSCRERRLNKMYYLVECHDDTFVYVDVFKARDCAKKCGGRIRTISK